MKSHIVYICLLTLWAASVPAQDSPTSLQKKAASWQTSAGLTNSSIGIAVIDNKTGEELIKSVPQLSLAPASILKVATTATMLEVFGPDYRFKTTLSYSGIVRNDTLFGDLQIIGGGDPTLGSMYFPESGNFLNEWTGKVTNRAIRTVTGNLVVDASVYEPLQVPGSWVWEDLGNYYGAGACGLSVYDNLYEIHLTSPEMADQPTHVLKVVPEIPGLELQNEVRSSDINSDQAFVFGNPEDNFRIIRGTIPKGKDEFVVKASVPNPPALLAHEFRKKLAEKGISLKGNIRFEKAKPGSPTLTETLSPPLREIIRATNFESINLFAEHFLKHLGWQKTGLGSTKDGCKFVVGFWKEKGIDVTGFFMNDGSGLSRFDAITASQICGVLNYMKMKSRYAADFEKSLPTAGTGTLTAFSQANFPQDCLHAKSGSMTRVRCYAGYLKTDSGRDLSFAVMLNNFSCNMREATQKVEELLVELRKL